MLHVIEQAHAMILPPRHEYEGGQDVQVKRTGGAGWLST